MGQCWCGARPCHGSAQFCCIRTCGGGVLGVPAPLSARCDLHLAIGPRPARSSPRWLSIACRLSAASRNGFEGKSGRGSQHPRPLGRRHRWWPDCGGARADRRIFLARGCLRDDGVGLVQPRSLAVDLPATYAAPIITSAGIASGRARSQPGWLRAICEILPLSRPSTPVPGRSGSIAPR